MGTFGFGPFDNDDALDFLDEIEDAAPEDREVLLRAALDQVLGDRGYLAAPKVSEAIAAAAVVGVALHPDEECAEPALRDWVRTTHLRVDRDLAAIARRALSRALAPEDNELWTLWDEVAGLTSVRAGLASTLRRLGALPA